MPARLAKLPWKDPRIVMRAILGVLLVANLAGAVIAFKPFGGSADDLRRERVTLQQQLIKLQAQVANSRQLVQKVESARSEGGEFLEKYVTDRQVVSSTIQSELNNMAESSGVVFQPTSWNMEPIDGSDTLLQMTINAVYQGTYQALAKFLNLVDKSPRFIIIESLTATQLQAGDRLNVTIKLDTFVRQQPGDDLGTAPGGGAPAEPAEKAAKPTGAGL